MHADVHATRPRSCGDSDWLWELYTDELWPRFSELDSAMVSRTAERLDETCCRDRGEPRGSGGAADVHADGAVETPDGIVRLTAGGWMGRATKVGPPTRFLRVKVWRHACFCSSEN